MIVGKTGKRLALVAVVASVALFAAATLITDAAVDLDRAERATILHPQPERWQSCPVPPCMAPCMHPPAAEVRCKEPGGPAFVTSFTCCCCGGSEGVRYQPL